MIQRRLLTEYEWRRQAAKTHRQRPAWYGPQCVYPRRGGERLKQDRFFHFFLLMTSFAIAFVLPQLVQQPDEILLSTHLPEAQGQVQQIRNVSAVSYGLPHELQYQRIILTRDQLLRGKMLLLDENHPLPTDVPPPNTASIAIAGKGMVPVRSLNLKAGRETIDALTQLFSLLRKQNVDGLYAWAGSTTAAEQRKQMIEQIRDAMKTAVPEVAVMEAHDTCEVPGTGERLQEYAVELRFVDHTTHLADHRALEATPDGQKLLQFCWRMGFVRTDQTKPFCFRYVGNAHATAMTYLELKLEEYLQWLHEKGVIVISAGGKPQYIILCKPMNGNHIAFEVPVGARWEASLDNTGYALVACTL